MASTRYTLVGNDMDKLSNIWISGGALILAAFSALILTHGMMTPFVPMPVYQVVLAWILSYAFVIVLPLLYVTEYHFLSRKPYFGKIVRTATLILFGLSVLYFYSSWDYGVKYQGELHTRIVAVENALGFFAVLALSTFGISKSSQVLLRIANLLLFVLLAWCAFPYLGELP